VFKLNIAAYDIFFDGNVNGVPLTSLTGDITIVYWLKGFAVPSVTFGVLLQDGEHAFIAEMSDSPTLFTEHWYD